MNPRHALIAVLAVLIAAAVLAAALIAGGGEADAPAVPDATPSVATGASTPRATAPAGVGAPAGYAGSCAAAFPWGQQVRAPFVCIEEPRAAFSVTGVDPLVVRGFAGGSFESNVVVEVRAVLADGALSEGALARRALTYAAPDIGMPGGWQLSLTLPASAPAGPIRVTAYFESPRDGSRVVEASVDGERR